MTVIDGWAIRGMQNHNTLPAGVAIVKCMVL
jgi:hypothetical protein